ncbi:hypothetical protein HUO13_25625 [Saccharopolyspora erythraea]|uniref:hypothetical protein n=1 Tax=Saccharopolyspora erythraea TaxID=1836 RepID=UPI001BA571C5|nr:hypothetical protein [Saccharopolyspora erythraea]QUH03749.1 hypothetical protein HUO13_25625 [Saccharopolyspora erythraea]
MPGYHFHGYIEEAEANAALSDEDRVKNVVPDRVLVTPEEAADWLAILIGNVLDDGADLSADHAQWLTNARDGVITTAVVDDAALTVVPVPTGLPCVHERAGTAAGQITGRMRVDRSNAAEDDYAVVATEEAKIEAIDAILSVPDDDQVYVLVEPPEAWRVAPAEDVVDQYIFVTFGYREGWGAVMAEFPETDHTPALCFTARGSGGDDRPAITANREHNATFLSDDVIPLSELRRCLITLALSGEMDPCVPWTWQRQDERPAPVG